MGKLRSTYGQYVDEYGGHAFYSFPTVEALADASVEQKLRNLGFGYRAKYIQKTADVIVNRLGGITWIQALRSLPYEHAHAELQQLAGIGAKVADCICLMALDQPSAIPVDTHVWQIACRDYGLAKSGKSLTPRLYKKVGDHFRSLFGEYAGWAHSVRSLL